MNVTSSRDNNIRKRVFVETRKKQFICFQPSISWRLFFFSKWASSRGIWIFHECPVSVGHPLGVLLRQFLGLARRQAGDNVSFLQLKIFGIFKKKLRGKKAVLRHTGATTATSHLKIAIYTWNMAISLDIRFGGVTIIMEVSKPGMVNFQTGYCCGGPCY